MWAQLPWPFLQKAFPRVPDLVREAIDTAPLPTPVVVASLILPGSELEKADDPLAEISALCEAVGAKVVGGVSQKRPTPQPRTAFGKGKVEEISALCAELDAELLVVDLDLKPSQGKNLEEIVGVRVLDRSELILDIFATRARTRQAKLQVELAQLEYLKTRLLRMWSHLERTGGGIGTRGPGETQLETDRRIISKRISELKRKLDEIEGRSQRQSASRDDVLSLSLVGYTNAGKSTIMRQLTGTDVYIADQLFATLDTKVRRWEMGNGRSVTLSDTVGFVRDLPHHLVASFHATLEETLQADLLLHVCDAASPDLEIHIRAVKQVLEVLEAQEIPTLLIFNKSDCLTEDEKKNLEKKWPDATFVSALTENSLQPLDARVSEIMDQWSVEVRVCVPAGDGRLIAEIRQVATILHEQWEVDEWQATLRLLPRHWNPLKGRVQSYS